MGDSWIVSNLNATLTTWNDKLGEIWQLLTQSPQTFKDGQVWAVMVDIHGALQAIGYGLLVLFFAAGVVKTCGTFVEAKRPEQALKLFIRFALAKAAVTYGLDLMLAIFQIVQGMVSTVINQSGVSGMSAVTLPQELIDAINFAALMMRPSSNRSKSGPGTSGISGSRRPMSLRVQKSFEMYCSRSCAAEQTFARYILTTRPGRRAAG